MKIKSQKGLTMLMLVITIVVMLVLAAVITYFTVANNHLIDNAQDIKIVEEIQHIKEKINEEETVKQTLSGDVNLTLTQAEINAILGDYKDDLGTEVVQDSNGQKKTVLYYKNASTKLTSQDKQALKDKLNMTGK